MYVIRKVANVCLVAKLTNCCKLIGYCIGAIVDGAVVMRVWLQIGRSLVRVNNLLNQFIVYMT